ncbi:fibronectin type III domain-containing protein [Flagellimonas flava]|uniref:Fibronectin type-III domain-containing protein n=1 Tax=Flagellimonas flava TaxID=570519 RepID=A0A1M5IR37_9FLAO|nr:hypothetical protein SAMN04488116_0859 [Allomuricauda flava]
MIIQNKKFPLRYLLAFTALLGCSESSQDDEPDIIIEAPSDFEVKVESSNYNGAQISWSESFDPQNQTVSYDLYFEDELVQSNLTVRNYDFTNLEPSTTYAGSVDAKDTDGNITTAQFSFSSTANEAPLAFELESVTADNISAILRWTEAVDPEEEEVTYEVSVDGEIMERGLTREIFQVRDLKAATEYAVQIVALDTTGNERKLDFTFSTANGIYEGDVSLPSQQSIENFGNQGYIQITGNLRISGLGGSSNVSDLSPLGTLKEINGHLDINFMRDLKSLSGLTLEKVGKSLRINNNYSLESLKGLDNLKIVLGTLEIEDNRELKSVEHLDNLETVGNYLAIRSNYKITRVSGFNRLNLAGGIDFFNNIILEQVDGFQQVINLSDDLRFSDNFELHTIDAFHNLQSVDRFYVIDTKITDIDMFSSLKMVRGVLAVASNSELEHIDGLSSLEEITYGNLEIGSNPKITNLDALENLQTIGATLSIGNNTLLSDFCGLSNVMQGFVPSAIYFIVNNQYNPTIEQIANGQCKP